MTKTLIHSLTRVYVNVDVNFAWPRSYAAWIGRNGGRRYDPSYVHTRMRLCCT
jgi:hypothetical protein